MRFTSVDIKKPVNSLVSAIQQYCKQLIADPDANGIDDLEVLKYKVWSFAEKTATNSPQWKLENLDSEVHSYHTFQVYNLIYKGDNMVIQLAFRRPTYETAFLDYDLGRTA